MLGISGSSNTCKNPEIEILLKRLASCVGKFINSAVNNSELKTAQELMGEVCEVNKLVSSDIPNFILNLLETHILSLLSSSRFVWYTLQPQKNKTRLAWTT